MGVQPTPEMIARYSAVNKLHWQMLERGELTREEVLVERFAYLFREQGIPADPAACKTYYEDYLCLGHFFMPGAEDILAYLAPRYPAVPGQQRHGPGAGEPPEKRGHRRVL